MTIVAADGRTFYVLTAGRQLEARSMSTADLRWTVTVEGATALAISAPAQRLAAGLASGSIFSTRPQDRGSRCLPASADRLSRWLSARTAGT